MTVSADLLSANFAPNQSNLQPTPTRMASAATIAPTTYLTVVSGTVAVATITPPLTGQHTLALLFTDASPAATVTTGNIGKASTPIINKTLHMTYDPVAALYYPSY